MMNTSNGYWKKPTHTFPKDKTQPLCFSWGCAERVNCGLQFFVGDQLVHRDAVAVKAAGIRSAVIGVADNQNIDRLQVGRKVKFPADNVRLKIADPYRTKTQLGGLKHHVIGQDGSVNVTGLLLVKGTNPSLIMVGANNNSQRCAVDIGTLADLCQTFLTLNGDQVNGLKVRSNSVI